MWTEETRCDDMGYAQIAGSPLAYADHLMRLIGHVQHRPPSYIATALASEKHRRQWQDMALGSRGYRHLSAGDNCMRF
jgi:hypothetical protein